MRHSYRLKPSVRGVLYLSLLHGLLGAGVAATVQSQQPLTALPMLLVLASWFYTRRHPWLGFGKQAITDVACVDEKDAYGWRIQINGQTNGQEALPVKLQKPQGWPFLLVFVDAQDRRYRRLLVGDELAAEDLAALRARALQSFFVPSP